MRSRSLPFQYSYVAARPARATVSRGRSRGKEATREVPRQGSLDSAPSRRPSWAASNHKKAEATPLRVTAGQFDARGPTTRGVVTMRD